MDIQFIGWMRKKMYTKKKKKQEKGLINFKPHYGIILIDMEFDRHGSESKNAFR